LTVRRPARTERTREALLEAGRQLFCERPVDAVAIDDIVQAAEVSKGSFYNHFVDRDALARAVADEIRDRIERRVDLTNTGISDPAFRLVRGVCVYLRTGVDDPVRTGVWVRMHGGHMPVDAPLNRGLVEDLRLGMTSGRFQVPSLEAGLLFVAGTTHAALARVAHGTAPGLAISLAGQMGGLILRGLGLEAHEADQIAAQCAEEIVAPCVQDLAPTRAR
jgi:AcrR family transcriptional regulator